jgi:dolichol-phosphate mannosyltransferase
VLLACVLLYLGYPLAISQTLGFGAGVLGFSVAGQRPIGARQASRLGEFVGHLAVLVLGYALRCGVLALLSRHLTIAPQLALVLAAPAGLTVIRWHYEKLAAHAPGAERWRVLAIGIVLYAFALRVVFAGCIELLPEETYYWNYAQHLDFGYLDHPPMVAWLVRATTALFGQNEFAVRAGPLLCGAVTAFFVYRLTRNVFGEPAALAALLLTQCLPFFFLSGMLMTPDAPLTAAWAASLYFLERALVAGNGRAWWYAGLSLGLGMISKYTVAMLGVAAVLFMLVDVAARRWWFKVPPYGAALVALACFAPVIIWNLEHDWASFTFQTARRLAEAPRFSLHKLIASALILITPTGVWALVRAPFTHQTEAPDAARGRRWLMMAVLLPLCVFVLFSIRHEVKLDWTGAPWTGALPLLALSMSATGGASWRRAWSVTATLCVTLLSLGLCYLAVGIPGVPYGSRMELLPVGWRDLSAKVAAVSDAYRVAGAEQPVLVGLDRYMVASELAFYGRVQRGVDPPVSSAHLFGGIGLMYERWAPAASLEHRTLLLVSQRSSDMTDPALAKHAARLGPIESIPVFDNGRPVAEVYYRFAYDYRAE